MNVIVNPPRPGEPSYKAFTDEKSAVLSDLAEKAKLVEGLFNELPGYKCQPVMGAMYAFPKIDLPSRAKQEAKVITPPYLREDSGCSQGKITFVYNARGSSSLSLYLWINSFT